MTDTWVYTDKENGWVNVEDTEFEGIEETPYGRNVLYLQGKRVFFKHRNRL